jgi:hypothetical protein
MNKWQSLFASPNYGSDRLDLAQQRDHSAFMQDYKTCCGTGMYPIAHFFYNLHPDVHWTSQAANSCSGNSQP